MFAVLRTGGKQYSVRAGDVLKIERLAAEAGETVQFNDILMLGGDAPVIGTPRVAGAAVQALVLDQIRGDKTIHFVKRRRKHSSQRTKGHRQYLTVVRITDILASGAESTGVKAAVGSGKAAGPAAAGTRPANLLSAPRGGQPDDLKRIPGIGPKLEALLHQHGVFHFDQIAAWTPAEVAYMDGQLSLKGRIARDNWIEQAKQLAAAQE